MFILYKEAYFHSPTLTILYQVLQFRFAGIGDVFPKEMSPGLPPIQEIEHQIDFIPGTTIHNRSAYCSGPEETKEFQKLNIWRPKYI